MDNLRHKSLSQSLCLNLRVDTHKQFASQWLVIRIYFTSQCLESLYIAFTRNHKYLQYRLGLDTC